jgi:vanillate O-demethylase ferredoxin subunit
MAGAWTDVVVDRRRDPIPRVAVIDLVRPDGGELPEYLPGAHVDVLVGPAPGITRQYSLCGPPRDRARYRIAVLAETTSRGGSRAMHALEKGDSLRVSAPRNRFGLSPEAHRHILVAGGIGVTPLLAMALELEASGGDYRMHYCARSRAEAAFAGELDGSPRVRFHFSDGVDGQRLDVARDIGRPNPGTALYVCGPGGFMDHVTASALATGWPPDAIHKERFAPAGDPAPASRTPGSFTVRLASTGAEYEVPAGESVLDVLLANGVPAPHSCQQGICGECVVRVLAGEPDHRDDVLTRAERAGGLFTTCSSRARTPILEIDL